MNGARLLLPADFVFFVSDNSSSHIKRSFVGGSREVKVFWVKRARALDVVGVGGGEGEASGAARRRAGRTAESSDSGFLARDVVVDVSCVAV